MADESEPKRELPPLVDDDDDDDEARRSNADDPTDVWDEAALKEAGLNDVLERIQARAATKPTGPGGPSIEVAADLGPAPGPTPSASSTGPRPALQHVAPAPAPRGLSWPVTIGLALAVGTLVYFLVRFLR